ncbi:hypothetical protein LUTEI9C_80105 [Luteimonas sp. 9C]|nr:hypothetical protein LUTEI9C_80105 [Luteimonas sp. 9C]
MYRVADNAVNSKAPRSGAWPARTRPSSRHLQNCAAAQHPVRVHRACGVNAAPAGRLCAIGKVMAGRYAPRTAFRP